ncbi:MAG: glycosyltransferase family 9 protein [Gemmatimonadaceae bacterium]
MREPAAPRRVLVVQLRRLGDVVLTTALLEDLARAHPTARLDFLVGSAAAPLLLHHPLISNRMVFDPKRQVRMARAIRRRRYDWVIDVQGNPRTAMLTFASSAAVRAGWRLRGWRVAYTHTLSRRGRAAEYVARERQRLLELLGVQVGPARPRLVLAPAERDRAEAAIRLAGAPARGDARRVAIVVSATDQVRSWPVERFAELARELAAAGEVPIVLRNPGDDERMVAFRAAAPSVLEIDTENLRDLLGALAACDTFVSVDTGPAHMATALGVPRVTLFGSTDPAAWSPGPPAAADVRDPTAPVRRTREWRGDERQSALLGIAVRDVLPAVQRQLALRGTTAELRDDGSPLPGTSR